IFVLSGQVKFGGKTPISVGADLMANTEDPTISGFEDQKTGYVAQASIGQLKNTKDWLLGFYYANIERFSVIENFAQDDWWRFGSGHTNSSDLKGFEIRAALQIGKNTNLVARHYVTEMIVGNNEANRFRIDLNTKF
ncbi:MAG: putative porin, partial [bacterium]